MKKEKKDAFTLTELLVVVIVIGVLSATVLPKFLKVMETRKTTEAEGIMAAVRTEQERRCALDKPYVDTLDKLTDVANTSNSKNYTYALNSNGSGINATSRKKDYTLKMMSYADGGICCEGTDCSYLNKEYPSCSGFSYTKAPESCLTTPSCVADRAAQTQTTSEGCSCSAQTKTRTEYYDSASCSWRWGDWGACVGTCSCVGNATQACGCKSGGTQSRTCNTSTGTWSDWGDCSISDTCECPNADKPAATQKCNSCHTQKRTVTCDTETGKWSFGEWSTCSTDSCGGPSGSGDTCSSLRSVNVCDSGYVFDETKSGASATSSNYKSTCCKSSCDPEECGTCSESDCGGSDCGSGCGSGCGSDDMPCASCFAGTSSQYLHCPVGYGSNVYVDASCNLWDGTSPRSYKFAYHCTSPSAACQQ